MLCIITVGEVKTSYKNCYQPDEADSRRGNFILCRLPVLDRRAEGSSGGGKEQDTLIDFEEEIERFKPSLDVEAVEDAIVKSDLTDMTDIMMELIKERDGSKR